MNGEPKFDQLSEPGRFDSLGTVRVSQMLGIVSIYVKVAEDTWQPVYVDPAREEHLVPERTFGDDLASIYPVYFSPKDVA